MLLSQADQHAEIAGSRKKLEATLERPVDTFAYPYGNYSAETVAMVEAAGFEAALTIAPKVVEMGENLFKLGRFGVGDWNGEKFKQHLDEFFRT